MKKTIMWLVTAMVLLGNPLSALSQEETGTKMHISRGTVWRLIQSARKKIAQALTEGRSLRIIPLSSQRSPSI